MSRRLAVLLVLVLAGLIAPATLVWAHPPVVVPVVPVETTATVDAGVTDAAPAAEWRPVTSPWPSAWLMLAAVAAGVVASTRRPRRALALAIVLVLAIFAFEHGVHSVHHLDDRASSATCAVASAVVQLAGMLVDAPQAAHVAVPLLHASLPDSSSRIVLGFRSAHQGRAPPLAA